MIDKRWLLQLARLPIRLPHENTLLLGLAVLVGLLTGASILLFHAGIEAFHWLFQETIAHDLLGLRLGRLGIVVSLALAGVIVGWMMERFVGAERYHGLAGIIEAVALAGGRLPYRLMPVKSLAAALSLGAGASVGPEAPSVVIGAHIGSFFGQRLRLSDERLRLLVTAGASSAIAAAFRAPIAGVFFGVEVILNGEFTTGAFSVVVLAAVVASAFTQAATDATPVLGQLNFSLGHPLEIVFYAALGALLAPVAVLFIHMVHWQHHVWSRLKLTRPLKAGLTGALVGLAALAAPQIMGPGREVMADILGGRVEFAAAALIGLGFAKLFMTAVSIGGGFVGGIFAPTLFVGTALGGAFGLLVTAAAPANMAGGAQAYAIAGMAAVMAGVVRAPITGILLVFELTNDYRLILPIMFTTVICVYLTERLVPAGIDTLSLLRQGVRLQQGRDVDVMQSITVGEVMTTPAPTISPSATLSELRDSLRQHRTRTLCVVQADGELVGIVSLSDLQRAYDNHPGDDLTVGDICTRDVVTAAADDVLWTAIRSMGMRDLSSLPVMAAGAKTPVGLLTRSQVMQAYNLAIARKREAQSRAEAIRLNALTRAHVIELHVAANSWAAGRRICDIDWPTESAVASITRQGRLIVPHGSTHLLAGDAVTLVVAPDAEQAVKQLFDRRLNDPQG